MAFFGVTIEEIDQVLPIPGADRIEQATLKNMLFSFVVGKNTFKNGDKVLYFPVDSIVPENIQEQLGIKGKLSGSQKNRIKTVKLRGVISQGIVGSVSLIPDGMTDSEEITKHFGVEKYEPPVIPCKNANLIRLPLGLSPYDIEGADRYPNVLQTLMEQQVIITEKMEGSNGLFAVGSDGQVYVGQRRHGIDPKEGEEHTWWKVAKEKGLIDFAQLIWENMRNYNINGEAKDVVVYGEMCGPGIQGNIYKLTEHNVYVFDIKVGSTWLKGQDVLNFINIFNSKSEKKVLSVPVLANNILLKDWLNGKNIQDASTGNSVFGNFLREGIVIKPVEEQEIHKFGRLIIKQRSPAYLAQSEN